MPIDIRQFPCLNDNYGFLIKDHETGFVATIDTPDTATINNELENAGWRLTHILNTHHHWDHSGGNLALKEKWHCKIIGPRAEAERIPGLDLPVGEGDVVKIGAATAIVHDTPGHTAGHIIYHFLNDKAAFVGDTIFALGCGRLFEGSAEQMWASLSIISSMPEDTNLYCAHEYTQENAAFALTIDPFNKELKKRAHEIDRLRANGIATIPTNVGIELRTNPFLRAEDENLKATLGMSSSSAIDVFAETRRRKDNY